MTRDDGVAMSGRTSADETVLHRFAAWLDRSWHRVSGQSELDHLPPGEVERMAQDLGISTSDLERLARRDPQASALLEERLKLLGLDIASLEHDGSLRDLRRTCGLCDAKGVCRHDMSERPESGEWVDYCPNSQILTELANLANEHKVRQEGVKP